MKTVSIKEIKEMRRYGKQYNKLIAINEYKGQYALLRKIKPILIRIKYQTKENLETIEENEKIRKEGYKKCTYDKTTKKIGVSVTRRIIRNSE